MDDLLSVAGAVALEGDVDPVDAMGMLEDELVEVEVVHHPEEPLPAGMVVGDADVAGFAKGVLGGIDASNFDVELWATVAGADDDRLLSEIAEGFEDVLAKDFQIADDFLRRCVVDLTSGCGCTSGKL